ncbi:hypothetical protein DMUE_3504 [Dictyocoela muelleri]|nr:hypothetical protein DMUE_3504 [Dictyocoela muelleri]
MKKVCLLNYESLRNYFKKRHNNKVKCDAEDENITNSYKFTFSNDLFLQFDLGKCSSDRSLIFAADKNFSYIEKSHVWLGDGTFSSAPKGFSQLYILNMFVFSEIVPLIYIIMKTKNTKSYIFIFNFIKSKINREPKFMIIDFEIEINKAFRHVFPAVTINGCNFHFNQLIVKYL